MELVGLSYVTYGKHYYSEICTNILSSYDQTGEADKKLLNYVFNLMQ